MVPFFLVLNKRDAVSNILLDPERKICYYIIENDFQLTQNINYKLFSKKPESFMLNIMRGDQL